MVDYLRKMFDDNIRAIVPQLAMSAGTMIACSCREIWLSKHSNLGPIDPQVRGIPAAGVIEEFKRAFREVKADPAKAQVWVPIIGQYRPTFLSQCENAVAWSNEFVQEQLRTVMFKKDKDADAKAKKAVSALSGYRRNRTHERHLHFQDCKDIGLNVFELESDPALQDLVLTVPPLLHALPHKYERVQDDRKPSRGRLRKAAGHHVVARSSEAKDRVSGREALRTLTEPLAPTPSCSGQPCCPAAFAASDPSS